MECDIIRKEKLGHRVTQRRHKAHREFFTAMAQSRKGFEKNNQKEVNSFRAESRNGRRLITHHSITE
ncbi:MAG: hypothetical protein GXO85_08145 [Chlorobi bacterium]|nr:hypothetical protein [Chlorobiota bacterium]